MAEMMFKSILQDTVSAEAFFICIAASLALGIVVACSYMYRSRYTNSFVVTLAMLPAIVQVVIMLVNGNIGAGIAVMGAFSLVRFRSIPGSAREIGSIFLAMAIGLATGMGYIGIAVIFTLIMTAVNLLFALIKFGQNKKVLKELKVTIPESLDYCGMFDDLFTQYTNKAELIKVKTTSLGSLYKLFYIIELKDQCKEKELIDAIRCRNGNLDIACGITADGIGEL